ncbi:MAG: hypothetical protein R2722_08770 [Tessaracoccus sp.]
MQHLIDGYYTVEDDELYRLIALLHHTQAIDIEPSAAAGFPGPHRVLADESYLARIGMDERRLTRATHLVWATGGSMVPKEEMAAYISRGR